MQIEFGIKSCFLINFSTSSNMIDIQRPPESHKRLMPDYTPLMFYSAWSCTVGYNVIVLKMQGPFGCAPPPHLRSIDI
jgi:hypothetical protein